MRSNLFDGPVHALVGEVGHVYYLRARLDAQIGGLFVRLEGQLAGAVDHPQFLAEDVQR